MGSEQQFCLRWNNHQSTLVAVFDTLLESGTLVDCTLAAEGQYLKAHKVVLSACSPYFELLLSQHYEKHPIVILKDVKFQELKAMMDYMYRGEVNISQDQLGALLKAAESLQIKGLSDSGGGGTEREVEPKRRKESVQQAPPPPSRTPPILQHSSGLTIEHRRAVQPSQVPQVIDLPEDAPPSMPLQKMATTREGSISPVSRKRKKHRRRSSCDENSIGASGVLATDNHETSSSCELPPQPQVPTAPSIPATITPVTSTPISKPLDTQLSHTGEEKNSDSEMLSKPLSSVPGAVASPQTMPIESEPVVHKVEPQTEPLLEPKSEYLEDVNDDSVEDLTLDDDMDELDQPRAGPSHGGEGSSSQGTGFAPWHVTATDRSTDEVFMAAQEAVGAHRDSQGSKPVLNAFTSRILPHLDSVRKCEGSLSLCESDINEFPYVSANFSNQHHLETTFQKKDNTLQREEFHLEARNSSDVPSQRFRCRVRTTLKEQQLAVLWNSFSNNPRPNSQEKLRIAEMTGLSLKVVSIWFQNKRCLQKKKNSLSQVQ